MSLYSREETNIQFHGYIRLIYMDNDEEKYENKLREWYGDRESYGMWKLDFSRERYDGVIIEYEPNYLNQEDKPETYLGTILHWLMELVIRVTSIGYKVNTSIVCTSDSSNYLLRIDSNLGAYILKGYSILPNNDEQLTIYEDISKIQVLEGGGYPYKPQWN